MKNESRTVSTLGLPKILHSFLCRSLLLLAVGIYGVGTGFAAPYEITIEEAGSSESLFKQAANETDLVIKGHINHVDLLLLRQYCRSVERIDLTEATIEAYSDPISYDDYEASELSGALADTKTLKELILPTSLKSIASRALFSCKALQVLVVPCSAMPKTASGTFVNKELLKTITLKVPEELVETYRNTTVAAWKFEHIEAISSEPFAGLVFDDVYGDNYFPIIEGEKPQIFYVAYFDNGSKETINTIELTYWYDDNEAEKKTASLNDVQLLPGSSIDEGLGFCIFEAPNDTKTHLFNIVPTKVNGIEVNLGRRARPMRRYLIDNGFKRKHLMEIFVNPEDPKSMTRYQTAVTAVTRLLGKTKQTDKIAIVTIPCQSNDGVTSSIKGIEQTISKYRIDSVPLFLYNRDLMQPYGSLNNSAQLLDLSTYTPALRIGELTDVYEYLLQRSFHKTAFADLQPTLKRGSKDQKIYLSVKGKLSVDENKEDKYYLVAYITEDSGLPPYDKENDEVTIDPTKLYGKVVKLLSDAQEAISIGNDYSIQKNIELPDAQTYLEGKYRLVLALLREGKQPYENSIVQSITLPINEENITAAEEIVLPSPSLPVLGDCNGIIYSVNEAEKIVAIHAMNGVSMPLNQALAKGCYIVTITGNNHETKQIKYILK